MRLSYSLVILKVKYFQSLDRIIGMCWKACANINNEKYIQKVVLVAKITKILFIESLQYTGLKALRYNCKSDYTQIRCPATTKKINNLIEKTIVCSIPPTNSKDFMKRPFSVFDKQT